MSVGIARAAAIALAAAILAGCTGGTVPAATDEAAKEVAYHEDCYERVKLEAEPPKPERAVFVLVDQTTGLDERLQGTVAENLKGLLEPGTLFSIATFSARNKGNYATVAGEGGLQALPPEETHADLPVTRLQNLKNCLKRQAAGVKEEAGEQIAQATDIEASTFTHSEILASLKQLSEAVRDSRAKDRLVIVVSDLLEHSPATSFYSNQELRKIDPAAELEKAKKAGLIGDFGGARIAVVGAGLQSKDGEDAVRDTEALAALRSFWDQWIEASEGELAQYGEPDLVTELRWDADERSDAPAS